MFLNDKSYEGRVYERLIYFYLENLSLIGTKDAMLNLEEMALNYLKRFKDSSYLTQVRYLLGKAYAKNMKSSKAKNIFNGIIQDGNSSENIKELVRSEMTIMELKKMKS